MEIIEARNGYLYIEYSEPYQFKNLIQLMEKVLDYCKTNEYKKFLVDISGMTGKVRSMERFELAVKGTALFRKFGKVAVVYRKDEINRFAENVSVNRGMDARIFEDTNAAKEWLGVNN